LPVAKHGNRAASSRAGSADVLTELGVDIAPRLPFPNPALTALGSVLCLRLSITARRHGLPAFAANWNSYDLHLLGPLSNPAAAPRQIIGVWRADLVERLAGVLARLGTERAWGGPRRRWTGRDHSGRKDYGGRSVPRTVKTFTVEPRDFGLTQGTLAHLRGGDAQANAQVIREVLSGSRRDEARALVTVNAAAALLVAGLSADLGAAARMAEKSIDSGAAFGKLNQLVKATNGSRD